MSLIFGRLGQSFVDFGIILTVIGANPSPEQFALYQEAASNLKRDTARNALYLVCIGQSSDFATACNSLTLFSSRVGNMAHHVHLHGYLGSHRRTQC